MLWVELIIPACLMESIVHVEGFVVDTFVIPFTGLVEEVHFFGQLIGIDHFEIKTIMLLHKEFPLSAPIIGGCHWYDLLDWNIDLLHTVESESM